MATQENAVFLAVAAYSNFHEKTMTFRKSAEDHGVSIIFCDKGESWHGFYHHKIERMSEHLRQQQEEGKQFAFVLDSRDVVFIESLDSILAKFNIVNDGRVIFNNDTAGKVWPSHRDYLTLAVEEAMGSEYARLNAGAFAGDIETILKILEHSIALRHELKEGCPRPGLLERLYQDIGTRHLDDDQHLHQICLTYYPEWFRMDCNRELFALLSAYPKDIREYSDDPRRHDVINHAAIVHSPWLGRHQEWHDWACQNRWRR